MIRGADMRPWYQEDEGRYLIFTRRGINLGDYPSVKAYLLPFQERLEPKPIDWDESHWKGRKSGSYQWYEIQDPVDYYDVFNGTKIFWPAIGKLPRFSWGEEEYLNNNSGHLIPTDDFSLLGILQSRVIWFAISQICTPLRLRAGLWQYQQFIQFIARLPIPNSSLSEKETMSTFAMQITEIARKRYQLHNRARHRIKNDLGTPGHKLNQKLTNWWELDAQHFSTEVKKAFQKEIPVRNRDEWESWLQEQQEKHHHMTAEIVLKEKELNNLVYALYDLTAKEIALIEQQTQYHYGEV
jgi:hypothetical protein